MKRNLLLLLAVVFSVLGIDAQVRYTTTSLNMREDATVTSGIISTIPAGTSVKIEDDCDCKWIPVKYNGKIGYVSSRFLSKSRSFVNVHNNTSVRKSHASSAHTGVRYYTNSRGRRIQSPTHYRSMPAGATALCNDGTYSFSESRRGTCSHHGGVAKWY